MSKLNGRALTLCSGTTPTAENHGTILDFLVEKF